MTSSPGVDPLAVLRSSPLFRVLDEADVRALAAHLSLERFPAGELVIREGEPGDTCYLIRAGQAGVVTRDLIGQEVLLATFGPGDSFGESALVAERPRSATIRAVTDLEVYALSRAELDRLEAAYPRFAAHARRHVDLLDIDAFLKRASPFARLPRETIRRRGARCPRGGGGRPVLPGPLRSSRGAPGRQAAGGVGGRGLFR